MKKIEIVFPDEFVYLSITAVASADGIAVVTNAFDISKESKADYIVNGKPGNYKVERFPASEEGGHAE